MGSVMLEDPDIEDSLFELAWQEDFDQDSLDLEVWTTSVGDGCPDLCGFGNNELQYYSEDNENIRIEDGVLIIEAHKQKRGSSDYTSGKILTRSKLEWKWGRIDVRAKLPVGRGTWPAIWMLPTINGREMKWPEDGEIDIMEHVGYNHGMVYGTIHTKKYNGMLGTHKFDSVYVADAHENFHTYSIKWTEDYISWLKDDVEYFNLQKGNDDLDGWPFNQNKFHLIINLAVGGNWGGRYGVDDDIWPQKLMVDYIKYYKLKNNNQEFKTK